LSQKEENTQEVVAIDGFAGVGKSTVAREVARRLGFVHLNSGAIYRGVALLALRGGISFEDESSLMRLSSNADFSFALASDGTTSFILNGEEPIKTGELLRGDVSDGASRIAVFKQVREFANDLQRKIGEKFPIVLEGRDAGTIVFPKARWKFFLEAGTETRAQRRLEQLSLSGQAKEDELKKLIAEIEERDSRDRNRALAPTVKAGDAIVIDTSEISADEVVDRILSIMNRQLVEESK